MLSTWNFYIRCILGNSSFCKVSKNFGHVTSCDVIFSVLQFLSEKSADVSIIFSFCVPILNSPFRTHWTLSREGSAMLLGQFVEKLWPVKDWKSVHFRKNRPKWPFLVCMNNFWTMNGNLFKFSPDVNIHKRS